MGRRSPGQSGSLLHGKDGSPSPLRQVIIPTGEAELLKLPSGVPRGFFSTETLSRGAAAPATQY